jgi:hypothetical protein
MKEPAYCSTTRHRPRLTATPGSVSDGGTESIMARMLQTGMKDHSISLKPLFYHKEHRKIILPLSFTQLGDQFVQGHSIARTA